MGGDLNDTLTSAHRKYSISTRKTKKPVNSLKTLIKKHNLLDIWRDMNTNLRQEKITSALQVGLIIFL